MVLATVLCACTVICYNYNRNQIDLKFLHFQVWSYSRNTQLSYNWQFTNNDGEMNKHLQQCPYADVQSYDGTKLWHCLPSKEFDSQTLGQQIESSSVDFGKLQN